MALEVEEAFPSFSTERIRSKVQIREGPVTQRRLDYNAPLLSVRRFADVGGDARSKVWKLSAELSKEPLRIPGAVPFTWEHSPGRPKQPESPPPMPSSPSPPSTPSPPSVRRASPASPSLPPPPPPLRPLFIRSDSSTLFAPPPPPPPPPPPLPRAHPLPILTRRTVPHVEQLLSYSASPPPPPPPPPPHPPTFSLGRTQSLTTLVSQHLPDHERMGAFRLVDPTEGFLRVLRARREKAEPQEFLAAEAANEAVEASHKAVRLAEEGTLDVSAKCGLFNDDNAEVASIKENSSCVAVDAIVKRFLAEHPDVAAEEAASEARQDEEALEEYDQANLDAVKSGDLPCQHSKHDTIQGEDIVADAVNPCSIIPLNKDAAYISVLQVSCSDATAEEAQNGKLTLPDGLDTEYVPSWENGGSVCAPVSPSMDTQEVQLDAGHKQSLIKKQQNRRLTNSIAILDSCRVESLRMIKSTFLQLCRKAAAASLRTLGKAKRKFAASRRTSSSLEVVVHPNANGTFNEVLRSDWEEEAVVSEVKTIMQERLSQEAEQKEAETEQQEAETEQQEALVSIPHSQPIISPISSTGILHESTEINLCDEINADAKRECTPISSPKPSNKSSPCHETNEAEKDIVPSPPHHSPNGQDSPGLQPPEQEETREIRSRVSPARHVYAKSLGGDEPNEFYDASSRFGSRGSTPSRINLNRSMSKDWSMPDDFVDATSTPFETPRTSVSDVRYAFSNAEHTDFASKVSSSVRPSSKLSKRVGKSLWVETREINATGKVDAISKDELKGFISGELYSDLVLSTKEVNGTRRKYASGDQASSSKSEERRQYKRGASRSVNGTSSSHAIAVTPVFPSKCQKNRSIASASGLPRQISTGNMADMGWPLGISGYPPVKTCTKAKEESKERGATKGENNMVVPSPPLPPSPAGGSWLRKALSHSHAPSRLAGLHAVAKKVDSSPSPGNKWEDIVKGSHVQPGHLRFSEELHHHPPDSTSNKYYVS